jgi:class I fructose-bisphosphate aldolase
MEWVVKAAGRTGVLVQGGNLKSQEILKNEVESIMNAGAKGLAIGRNVWQADNPIEVAKFLAELVF